MRKINVVAITLFKKRVRTPSYYWMIFAPLILGIVILFVNNYVEKQQSNNSNPIIAVSAPKEIRNLTYSYPAKTYKISKIKTDSSKASTKFLLSDYNIDGILRINKDFDKIEYIYLDNKMQSTTELSSNLQNIHAMYKATQLGLSMSELKDLMKVITIKQKSIDKKHSDKSTESVKNFSEIMIILSFFILNSYISIIGSEIGKEKGQHLLEGILAVVPAKKHFIGKMLGIIYLMIFQIVIYSILIIILKDKIPKKYFSLIKINSISSISKEYIFFIIILTLTSMILYILLTGLLSSLVSRNEDITQVTTGISILLFVPYILSFLAQENSDLFLLKILSYVPFINQGIMPIRVGSDQISLLRGYSTIAINIIASICLFFLTIKVYQKNALNYNTGFNIKRIFKSKKR